MNDFTLILGQAGYTLSTNIVEETSMGGRARRLVNVLLIWLIAISIGQTCMSTVSAEERHALLIGNGAYRTVTKLTNPANDLRLMASTLQRLNFEVVAQQDLDRPTMMKTIKEFGHRLQDAGQDTVALFYYAGHGIQADGSNYLLPVDVEIARISDVDIEAVNLHSILGQMENAANRLNFVILDACRNNPISRGTRSAERGLAQIEAPSGTLIAYATAPGQVALDGEDDHSPYTKALARALEQPGVVAEEVFRNVRVEVMAATGNDQVPWESSSLTGAFYFDGTDIETGPQTEPTSEPVAAQIAHAEPREARPEENPLPPKESTAALPLASLGGYWEGQYQCQQDVVGMSLEIAEGTHGQLRAVFEFFPLPGRLSFPRGRYEMTGNFNADRQNIRLHAQKWIERPFGFQKHDLEGLVEGATISGRILTTGCGHFVLSRH